VWFDDGFCPHSVTLMSAFCKKTSGFCSGSGGKVSELILKKFLSFIIYNYDLIYSYIDEMCVDSTPICTQWANSGLCVASQEFMLANCPKSCEACKTI
jgi:hypothetical protein